MPTEKLLRALFVPGQVYGDLSFSPPVVYELVSINGVERIRYYQITSTRSRAPFVHKRSSRHRAVTLFEWERLTGERLTHDLKSVAKRRMV